MTQGVFKKTGYRNAQKSEQRYDRAQHRARRRRLFVSRRAAGGRKGPARWRAEGFSGTIAKTSATVAEVLKDYGYNTGAWGKWHNTPEE